MRTLKKRRREGRTDYKARLVLIKAGLPRVVVRKTNKYLIAQYVESKESRDTVVIGVTSKDLLSCGWGRECAGSLKSLSACYFTGLLLGNKIKDKNQEVILDIGLCRNIKKSRIYAFLKGLIDAGINIRHDKGVFPDESRLRGEHLKNKPNFEKIRAKLSGEGRKNI